MITPGTVTTLVILPGMDGTGLLHGPFISALGPGFDARVVRYPVDKPLGYAGLESAARAALPETGPFFVLGESFSGPIAVSLAASFPSRVQGLILCCSFVRNPRPGLAWVSPFLAMLPLRAAPMAALSHLLLGAASSSAWRALLAEALARVSPKALRARLRAVLSVDISGTFAALDLPILYLRGTRDRVVPRPASELAATLNSRTAIIDVNAPHFLLQAAPAEAALAIRQFVALKSTTG